MILPEITLIECADGTCKIKADMTKHGGEVNYLHVKHGQWKMISGILEYNKGKPIQECFPFLDPEEREFMLTGLTPVEQERMYKLFEDDSESFMGSSET